ncbi:NepR family anti-sigma factor [Phreatobacter stygius]|uniref:Anti-sigma factor NepR domain-containing protein n=1 Tax=Phreatobacter stygius TaxID=1940610 RepID=A0A4D7BAV0_9HYPH|nr:NepR family anti-sigma factor [Phreatobacter stygius]QCI67780.1 hypothetical protein E8M01_28280 [Phreatobacter stygius]
MLGYFLRDRHRMVLLIGRKANICRHRLASILFLARHGTFLRRTGSLGGLVYLRLGERDASVANRQLRIPLVKVMMRTSMVNPRDEDPARDFEVFENEPVLDQRVQDAIGRSLKAHYDDLVRAPIPDRFLVLLAQLEAKELKAQSNGETDER